MVKKLYDEISNWEEELFNREISNNWKLLEDLESLKEVKKKLDSEVYSPSKTSIKIILAHSKKTAPIETSC